MPSDNYALPLLNSSNAIWDDGEWISWEEINRHLELNGPNSRPVGKARGFKQSASTQDLLERLDELVEEARDLEDSGQKSRIDFGEMGELYAQIRYGLKRHRKYAQGSDGKVGNDFVEVKTITPWKTKKRTSVRRSGHFSKLVVVKIDENYLFESRIIPRSLLPKGRGGKALGVSWSSMPKMK